MAAIRIRPSKQETNETRKNPAGVSVRLIAKLGMPMKQKISWKDNMASRACAQ
jgi:hypothetical protein